MCFTNMIDAPTVFRAKLVRARKPHECCECRRTIKPGQRYETCFGVWEGEGRTYATCLLCYDLRGVIRAIELDDGCDWEDSMPGFTGLLDALRYGDADGEMKYPALPEVLASA